MKKLIIFIAVLFISSSLVKAQDIFTYQVEFNGTAAMSEPDMSTNNTGLNLIALYRITSRFSSGIGTGLSYNYTRVNNVIGAKNYKYRKYESNWAIPIFLKAKYVFLPYDNYKPYISAEIGSRYANVKSISGIKINPYRYNALVSIGVDYAFRLMDVGLEFGLNVNSLRIYTQEYKSIDSYGKPKVDKNLNVGPGDLNFSKRSPELIISGNLLSKQYLQNVTSIGLYSALVFSF